MEMILNFIFKTGRMPTVIVCHCHGVSERAIRQKVREGACSLRQVARASGAGRMCGGCRPEVRRILEEEKAENAAPAALPVPAAVAAS